MLRSTICLTLILFIGALAGCTKDILSSPELANIPGQTTVYKQTFNTAYPGWPTGWSAAPSQNGWLMDTSAANNSSGVGTGEGTYTGASGGAMVEISNPTSGSAVYDTMYTGIISTVGYTQITAIYGYRDSKHFSDAGSTIKAFQYSVDGGKTWTSILSAQDMNDSNWHLVNGGVNMQLGNDANGSSVMFRWIAYIAATASGSYRIDDFQVYGTAN